MENNSKQAYNYTVILEKEQDGGYHAFCPILKGCHSQGDTFEEAIENITGAIELYLESLMADNQSIFIFLLFTFYFLRDSSTLPTG